MGLEPIPFSMTSSAAERIIRELAADSAHVVILPHAQTQMRTRRISLHQVLECLRCGRIIEGPVLDIKGYWRSTLFRRHAGDDVHVVASIAQDIETKKQVLVITTF